MLLSMAQGVIHRHTGQILDRTTAKISIGKINQIRAEARTLQSGNWPLAVGFYLFICALPR
jgi:hypothetical protein